MALDGKAFITAAIRFCRSTYVPAGHLRSLLNALSGIPLSALLHRLQLPTNGRSQKLSVQDGLTEVHSKSW
jgi:hypothetical protein